MKLNLSLSWGGEGAKEEAKLISTQRANQSRFDRHIWSGINQR
jgi:hypothetical protein